MRLRLSKQWTHFSPQVLSSRQWHTPPVYCTVPLDVFHAAVTCVMLTPMHACLDVWWLMQGVRMSLEYGIMFGTGRAGVPPPPSAPPASLRLPSGQWTMQYKLPPATQVPPLLPAASNDAAVWSWYQRAR
jgi:hypothetical protein